MDIAITATLAADILIVVGTSLQVYPAASLLEYVADEKPKFIIDPNMPNVYPRENLHLIQKGGSEGMQQVREQLLK